jgi:tRNA G18 (ribose-2'-O)-methylase SpoU
MAAAVESLNVAVAGSILLYELARNRAAGPSGLKSGGPS